MQTIGILLLFKSGFAQSDYDKIVGQTIFLKNGQEVKTEIFNLKFLGQIRDNLNSTYFILSGRPCDSCDANISIYIHSPLQKDKSLNKKSPSYSFPGKLTYYVDNSLIFESRAFFGEVLPDRYGIIWFQKERDDQKKLINSVFFVEIIKGKIVEKRQNESLVSTLEQVKINKAFEIIGMDQTSEP